MLPCSFHHSLMVLGRCCRCSCKSQSLYIFSISSDLGVSPLYHWLNCSGSVLILFWLQVLPIAFNFLAFCYPISYMIEKLAILPNGFVEFRRLVTLVTNITSS
ncbi:hypothetical protein VNO80_03646 [Phaseolus coccineus]|uniref:Uncharacterized protein n=1 Tax=Phaseolus coccineus TaxID=3886 RepID=A0AAN9NWF6_PHACN